jgi:hypothetical protein
MSTLLNMRMTHLASVIAIAIPLVAQQAPPREERPEDNLQPTEFTDIIKEAWTFLKDETEALLNASKQKNEFETTQEFERRIAELRRAYIEKTTRFYKEKRYDQREFGILFKAQLVSYDADTQTYTLTSNTVVEIPYDIPWLDVTLEQNPLVALADSISKGYRSTSMYLKMNPPLRFEVPRDLAKSVKADEGDLYFRVRVTLNTLQQNFRNHAILKIYANSIQLFNRKTNLVYWEERL